MIRKKKNDQEELMTPLSDIEDVDNTEAGDESEGTEPEKKKRFGNPFKKKGKKDNTQDVEENEVEGDDPLNLAQEGKEYLVMEDEKKFPLKKVILIAGIVLVCVVGAVLFVIKNIGGSDSGKAYVQNVGVLAGLGSANGGTNRYTGVVEPQNSWNITLDADMSVAKCYVKVGDEVKKGDKLFAYNTDELKLNKEKKQLEITTMENEVTQLTKDINTYETDLKSASASEKIELQTQILTAQTTIKKDQFSIKSAKQEVEKIEKTIKDATVKSKMDGVVKKINKNLGSGNSNDDDSNYSSDGTEDSSTYMQILAIGDYRVKGKINETNAPSLEEGTAMIVRSRTSDQTWTGTLENVKTDSASDDTSSSSDDLYSDESSAETATNYNFYVKLKDDTGLMMGQHVFIEVDNGQDDEDSSIKLSSAYILEEDDKYYVYADNGHKKLEKRQVDIGEYDDVLDEYYITDGIDTDDYIACIDDDTREGMATTKVQPANKNTDGDETEGGDEEISDDFDEGGIESDDYDDGGEVDFDDGAVLED